MARPPRIWYEGAVYHVMNRGVRQEIIFNTTNDYLHFLKTLEIGLKKYNCTLYAFCLMTNHYHLLIRTTDKPLCDFMKWFQRNYSRTYNMQHDYSGHVFESRYRAVLVMDARYFIHVSRYIHLNPVKAGIVIFPEEYRWSSYQEYIGTTSGNMVNQEIVRHYFSEDQNGEFMTYQEFVECKLGYEDEENQIRKDLSENEQWMPE